jgi:hypothetical protein
LAPKRPVKVRLGDYDITRDCDCLDGKCAPLPQTVIFRKNCHRLIYYKVFNVPIFLKQAQ